MHRIGAFAQNIPINPVKISDWYDAKSIVASKIEYVYNEGINKVRLPQLDIIKHLKDILEDNKINKSYGVQTLNAAICDKSKFDWGLDSFLTQFFNHSQRAIMKRFVRSFLHLYEQKEMSIQYNQVEKNRLAFFTENMKKVANCKRSMILLQMCRKYLMRLLVDFENSYIYRRGPVNNIDDKERYFNKIRSVYTPGSSLKEIEINSYARRVLAFLSKVNDDSGFMSVSAGELIRKVVFHDSSIPNKQNFQISKKKLEAFADILFELNLIRREDTNWIGLIYINVPDGKAFKKDHLKTYIKQAWEDYKMDVTQEKETVTVKLTQAGEWFSRFMSDFEYFSCVSVPVDSQEFRPLLAIDNNPDLERLLNTVYDSVETCVLSIESAEQKIHKNDITWNDPRKSYRDITADNHIGYLRNFRHILDRSDLTPLQQEVRDSMRKTLASMISRYERFKQIPFLQE